MRLLLVTDNRTTREEAGSTLCQSGYAVDTVTNGREPCELLRSEVYDGLIIDLPEREEFEVLQRARKFGLTVPILVLLTTADTDARIKALEIGADDIMSKPFEFTELDIHIRALIRRSTCHGLQLIRCGSLTYDTTERLFRARGEPLDLPRKQHAVLETLITRQGRMVRKETIYEKVYSLDTCVSQEAIEVYMYRLRHRLAGFGVNIVSMRGQGYRIQAAGSSAKEDPAD